MLEHAAEPLLALHLPDYGLFIRRLNRHVADALMRPFGVVVLDVLSNDVSKLLLSEEDHLVQALVLDGADEPFGIGVEVW